MEPRAKKQLIIGSIFAVIILIIAFGVYFFYFRTTPTCTDHKQNQGEEEVDCGGPCQACEIKNLKNIEILWAKALPTKDQNYDLVASISNVNQNHGSRKVDYQFKMYDLNNNLIAERSGTTFILPRQQKYIAELKVPVAGQISKISLDLGQVQWEKINDYLAPEIDILDKQYQPVQEGTLFAQASCLLKNSGQIDFKAVKLVIVLFDSDNQPLAVNAIDLDGLAAGQQRYFSAPWLFPINGKVSQVDAEAQVNIFK